MSEGNLLSLCCCCCCPFDAAAAAPSSSNSRSSGWLCELACEASGSRGGREFPLSLLLSPLLLLVPLFSLSDERKESGGGGDELEESPSPDPRRRAAPAPPETRAGVETAPREVEAGAAAGAATEGGGRGRAGVWAFARSPPCPCPLASTAAESSSASPSASSAALAFALALLLSALTSALAPQHTLSSWLGSSSIPTKGREARAPMSASVSPAAAQRCSRRVETDRQRRQLPRVPPPAAASGQVGQLPRQQRRVGVAVEPRDVLELPLAEGHGALGPVEPLEEERLEAVVGEREPFLCVCVWGGACARARGARKE